MKNLISKGVMAFVYLSSMAVAIPMESNAQSLLKKVKSKVENSTSQKVIEKTDKAVSKTIDKIIESVEKDSVINEKAQTYIAQNNEESKSGEPKKPIGSFSKYDFIPGDTVIYGNDFSSESIGELPAGWNSNKSSVIVSLDNFPGKWLRLSQNSISLTDNEKSFGSDFTVEFDLIIDIDFKGWMPPSFQFGLLASGKLEPSSNKLLSDPKGDKSFYMEISPLSDAGNISLESYLGYIRHFNSSPSKHPSVKGWYSRPVHVAIQGQKERLRIWIDGEKLLDVPKGIAKNGLMNQLFFRLGSSPYQDEQVGIFISNIKIAKGTVDARHKLLEEGKFTTTGILFETASASIKPESLGVLRSIASVLEKNPAIKINVIGHTDATGSAENNLTLSEKRAEAVKNWLISVANIDEKRLNSIGKGETEPVADNNTTSGRTENRRVEFIKI